MSLTNKQKIFCKEYIIDFNATRAYTEAFPNVTKRSARTLGCLLLTKVDISNYISTEIQNRAERLNVSQDRIIHELMKIAFSDISNYIGDDGDIDLSNDAITPVIKELRQKVIKTIGGDEKEGQEDGDDETTPVKAVYDKEIKLYDKMKALELLGKHLAMFTDKVEVKGEIDTSTAIEIKFED